MIPLKGDRTFTRRQRDLQASLQTLLDRNPVCGKIAAEKHKPTWIATPSRTQLREILITLPSYIEALVRSDLSLTYRKGLYDLPERLYELYNRVGILSLSETPDNRLMWAHYAKEHTGFVLMLDGCHDFFKGDNLSSKIAKGFAKPERVEYRLERPRTSIEDPPREILLIKDSDWQYEKEWRYLKHIDDAAKLCGDPTLPVALFRLPSKCIRGVILGYNSSKELKNKVVALRRDDPEFGHLRIQQARASTTRYPLRIEEIKT